MANDNKQNETGQTGGVRDSFLDEPTVQTTPTPGLDLDRPKKIVKKLKGIHIDEDVLDVFQAEQSLRERGWGSQIVSDLLREKFEEYNMFERHKIKNLKKDND